MGCGPIVIRTLITRKIKRPKFSLFSTMRSTTGTRTRNGPKKREICLWAHEVGVTFDILVEVHCNEWIIGYRLMLVIHKSL